MVCLYYSTFVPRTIVQKTYTNLLVQVIVCVPQLAAQPNKANKMAQAKNKAVKTTVNTTFGNGSLTANTNTPVGVLTGAMPNGLGSMVTAILANTNAPVATGKRTGHIVPVVNGLAGNAPTGAVALQVGGSVVNGTARQAHLAGAGAAKSTPTGMFALTTKGIAGKAGGSAANVALTQALQQACSNGPITGAALLQAMGGTAAAASHITYRLKGGWLQKA
jgi:hypothetical protein